MSEHGVVDRASAGEKAMAELPSWALRLVPQATRIYHAWREKLEAALAIAWLRFRAAS